MRVDSNTEKRKAKSLLYSEACTYGKHVGVYTQTLVGKYKLVLLTKLNKKKELELFSSVLIGVWGVQKPPVQKKTYQSLQEKHCTFF